jgi:DNA-binding MarR family transcriptional regulator
MTGLVVAAANSVVLRYDGTMPSESTSSVAQVVRAAREGASADERRVTRDERPLTARDPRLASWRTVLTAQARLIDRLDEELRAEADLSLAQYSALLHLAEAPGHRMRMSQLASGALLSRSGTTRLVDRLETEGLVARDQCPSDGRGAEAVLTEAGLTRLRVASRTHLRGIKGYFLDQVPLDDLAVVERSMAAIAAHLRESETCA